MQGRVEGNATKPKKLQWIIALVMLQVSEVPFITHGWRLKMNEQNTRCTHTDVQQTLPSSCLSLSDIVF